VQAGRQATAAQRSATLLSKRRRKDVLVLVKVRPGYLAAANHIVTGEARLKPLRINTHRPIF